MLGPPIGHDISTAGRRDWCESEKEAAEKKEQDSSGIIMRLQ